MSVCVSIPVASILFNTAMLNFARRSPIRDFKIPRDRAKTSFYSFARWSQKSRGKAGQSG